MSCVRFPILKNRSAAVQLSGIRHYSRFTVRALLRLMLLGGSLLPGAVYAASPTDINALQHQNDIILLQQQEQLRQDQEKSQRSLPPGGTNLETPAAPAATQKGPCRTIREITVGNAPHLPFWFLRDIRRQYQGSCLSGSDIESLLTQITDYYFHQGYVTSHAYLPAQDLNGGQLKIIIVEGVIGGIAVDTSGSNRLWLPGVFPGRPGDVLNLRDLEQGIDQINRATSNNAHLDIQPGAEAGQSLIIVHNVTGTPLHLLTSVDNTGTSAVGRRSDMAAVTEDGLLRLNEIMSITHRQTFPDNARHFSRTDAFDAAVPLGYNTLSFDISSLGYNDEIGTPSGLPLLTQGNTLTRTLTLDHVAFRDQDTRINLSGAFTAQRTDSYLAGQLLDVSSRDLSYGDAGAALYTSVDGGLLTARLDMVRGLPILHAAQDPSDLPATFPHAQFLKYTLDFSYDRPFHVGSHILDWNSHFSGQEGITTLFGSQQFAIGGTNTVRGFLDNSLSGDNGYFWRNDLSLLHNLNTRIGALTGRVYAGFDTGCVSSNSPDVPSGALVGAAVGVAEQWHNLSFDVFYTHPLMVPSGFTRESGLTFFRLSYSL